MDQEIPDEHDSQLDHRDHYDTFNSMRQRTFAIKGTEGVERRYAEPIRSINTLLP